MYEDTYTHLAFQELGLYIAVCGHICITWHTYSSVYEDTYIHLAFEELGSPHACPLEPFAARYMCPHTTIYVSSYYYHLYMCPHASLSRSLAVRKLVHLSLLQLLLLLLLLLLLHVHIAV